MALAIRPVTPDLWPALEDLFGKAGASNGCWCMYWRVGSAYHERPREQNQRALRAVVFKGPPPGLLAFDGALPVGWCQLTPRSALPWLHQARFFEPVDDERVWAISCFYVRRGYRRQGVMSALVAAAVKEARKAHAPAVEAYPVDTSRAGCTTNVFTGTRAAFERLGFRIVASRQPCRPIMRHDLRRTSVRRRLARGAKPSDKP